jgi:MYXO-CTERM domain-containing protein
MDDDSARSYASRVFALLRTGADFPARDGERVTLAAHPEINPLETIELAPQILTPAPVDFPGAISIPTSCNNKCTIGRPLGAASVNKIVIHDTEIGWDGAVATLQNDPAKSVHYIVDADGSRVGQFRSEGDTTWHAGNFYYNETSVGIEHVGHAADPHGYNIALYQKSVELVTNIRTRHTIPLNRNHIIGHYQVPKGVVIGETAAPCSDQLDVCENSPAYGGSDNHRDPGENWQWCEYMEMLGGSCTCNDAWDHYNCTTDHTEAWRCKNGQLDEEKCTGPAGCTVEAIGQDDMCDTSGPVGSDGGIDDGGTGDGGGGGGGGGGGDGGNPDNGGHHGGGCSTSGTGGGMLALVVAGLVFGRRRRR